MGKRRSFVPSLDWVGEDQSQEGGMSKGDKSLAQPTQSEKDTGLFPIPLVPRLDELGISGAVHLLPFA